MAIQLRSTKDFNPDWTKRETKIDWLVEGNPKMRHGKSYARFERYFGADTVGDYYDNSGSKGDLRHDWAHQFLDLIENSEEKPDIDKIAAARNVAAIKGFNERLNAPNLDDELIDELKVENAPGEVPALGDDIDELEVAEITEEELLAS